MRAVWSEFNLPTIFCICGGNISFEPFNPAASPTCFPILLGGRDKSSLRISFPNLDFSETPRNSRWVPYAELSVFTSEAYICFNSAIASKAGRIGYQAAKIVDIGHVSCPQPSGRRARHHPRNRTVTQNRSRHAKELNLRNMAPRCPKLWTRKGVRD